ncbi:dehydrogenase [Aeromicrobium sp. PE09-221]|uniref:SDR family oxidoreductase n=1 Tax=Aeromicrobium sp. PE09-221 TaxID=1898043 RepID=UPI000B3E9A39|nr:SDR family oxidoreductase [Aeromicrobium sp. PE09-221]OUZ12404.1 dehydrogenase [Aeromicrobium sp. PE09-221]
MTLQDKNVVVTGAGRGIGRAIAEAAAAQGARVVVSDVDQAAATEVADTTGGIAIAADLSKAAEPERLVLEAIATLDRIDVFFGNAGVDLGAGWQVEDRLWDVAMGVNLMAHVRAARELIPHWLKAGGGHYVVTASAAGLLSMVGNAPYSVSKHAAVAFAEWLSISYASRDIKVQAICPQGVNTQMLQDSGAVKDLLSHDALLEPRDVAGQAIAALSTDAFYVLPHPSVADYALARVRTPDAWLTGMSRLSDRVFGDA